MRGRLDTHLFWGSFSPLSALSGIGLVIMASSRFSFALICSGALIWVYGLTALIYSGAGRLMPARGKKAVLLFLSTFLNGMFMFFLSFFNPLMVLGMSFFLVLVTPCCLGSGLFDNAESVNQVDLVSRALFEALVLSGIILAFALIREPLGMGTLSFPGGVQGIIEAFESGEGNGFIPVRILSASAGGLLLLGYGISLYRYFREQSGVSEDR